MTGRPAPLCRAQQVELGRVVLALRRAGVPWKAIEDQLGMQRRQLWRCAGLACQMAGPAAMSQHQPLMSHHAACEAAGAVEGLAGIAAVGEGVVAYA